MRIICLLVLLGLAASASAAEFVVNSLGNAGDASDDGTCDTANDPERDIPPSGLCTLNAAIGEGQRQGGNHTITFAVEGVIDSQINARGIGLTIRGPITVGRGATFDSGVVLEDVTINGRLTVEGGATLRRVTLGERGFIEGDDVVLDDVATEDAITVTGNRTRMTDSRVFSFQFNGDDVEVLDNIVGQRLDGSTPFIGGCSVFGDNPRVIGNRMADEFFLSGTGAEVRDNAIGYAADDTPNPAAGQNRWENMGDCTVSDNRIAGTLRVDAQTCVFEGNQFGFVLDGTAQLDGNRDCQINGSGITFGTAGAGNLSVHDFDITGAVQAVDNRLGFSIDGVHQQGASLDVVGDDAIIRNNQVSAALAGTGANLIMSDNQAGLSADGTVDVQGNGVGFSVSGANAIVRNNAITGRVNLNGDDMVFVANRVGTDAAGTVGLRLASSVLINGDRIQVGGAAADRNVIFGEDAVVVRGDDVIIEGNHIGVNLAGDAVLGDGAEIGIEIQGARTRVGAAGDALAESACDARCNVIAGVERAISGFGNGHVIERNHIGVSRNGQAVLGGGGIEFDEMNDLLINNNRLVGLQTEAIAILNQPDSSLANAFVVSNNLINILGDGVPFRGGSGILVRNEGRDMAAGGQIIDNVVVEGFTGIGIRRRGAVEHPIVVQRNRIGVLPNGELAGNRSDGMNVQGGLVIIGGDVADGNHIAGSGRRGVRIVRDSQHRIAGNRIFENTDLGIALGNNLDPLINDPLDADAGPNANQNRPVIETVQVRDGQGVLAGTLQSTPNAAFVVEVFANVTCDPRGAGEGQFPLGRVDVQTDGDGLGVFNVNVAVPPEGIVFTATATDADGNTSEFSDCAQPDRLLVNAEGDASDTDPTDGVCDSDAQQADSQCTLRAAMEEAEARDGVDQIEFEVPGGRIQVEAALPVMTQGVVFEGRTQPGGAPIITGHGLAFDTADAVRVQGLRIEDSAADGVRQDGDGPVFMEAVTITNACGWGVQTAGSAEVGADLTLQNNGRGAGCEGGGLLVVGTLTGTGIVAVNNNGPGIAVERDISLTGVRSEDNAGHGVFSQEGLLALTEGAEASRIAGNGGAGIRLDLDCDPDALDCPTHTIDCTLTLEDNIGWGLVAESAIFISAPFDNIFPAPGRSVVARRNGIGPTCVGIDLIELDPDLPVEDCRGGGIFSASATVFAADVRAEANFGPGIMAADDIDLVRVQALNNAADGVHAAVGRITISGRPDAAEPQVVARGNRGFGLFSAGPGDDDIQVFGLASLTRIEMAQNGLWGGFATAGISVGQQGGAGIGPNARTIVRDNGSGVDCVQTTFDPGSLEPILEPVECGGGGLAASDASLIFQADVEGNQGTGIAVRAGLSVIDVQVLNNGGGGIATDFGEIEFRGGVTPSVIEGNAGDGVRSEGGDIEFQGAVRIERNAGLGINGGNAVRLGFVDDQPLNGIVVTVEGNGIGPECFQDEVLRDGVLPREAIDCFPGGILAARIAANQAQITNNQGAGIEGGDAVLLDTTVTGNAAFGIRADSLTADRGQICRNGRANLRVSGAVALTAVDVCDDADLDGITDAAEDAIGDGNADAIDDSEQADVTSLAAGDAPITFTLLEADGALRQVFPESAEELGIEVPANTELPFDLFSFRVEDIDPGATVRVRMTFPADRGVNGFVKLIDGDLVEFLDDGAEGAAIADGAAIITLVDGGRGDADGEVNGRISDPGGPAVIERGAPNVQIALVAVEDEAVVGAAVDLNGTVTNSGNAASDAGLLVVRTSLGTLEAVQLGAALCAAVDAAFECPVPALEPDESLALTGRVRAEVAGEATVTAVLGAAMASAVVQFVEPIVMDAGIEPDAGVDAGIGPDGGVDATVEVDAAVEEDATVYVDATVEEDAAAYVDATVEEDAAAYVDATVETDAAAGEDAAIEIDMPWLPVGDAETDAGDAGADAAVDAGPQVTAGDSGCSTRPAQPGGAWWWGVLLLAIPRRTQPAPKTETEPGARWRSDLGSCRAMKR